MLLDIGLFALVGFAAQLVDGAVGMAFGVIASSVLLSLSIPPAVASASVHAAEVFTTGASGLAHWRLGNVRPRMVATLAVPGVIGGVVGAYVLTDLPVGIVRPLVSAYLIAIGLLILWRALRVRVAAAPMAGPRVFALGLGGGFLDAVGGGGWGPMVAATLIGRGDCPRQSIGSTSAAEFFVTSAVTVTFLFSIGLDLWPIILGLVIGGVLAAPLAALVVRVVPLRVLLGVVAAVVILLGFRGVMRGLGAL